MSLDREKRLELVAFISLLCVILDRLAQYLVVKLVRRGAPFEIFALNLGL